MGDYTDSVSTLLFYFCATKINNQVMRKSILTLLMLFLVICQAGAQKAKYVFFFIGDGMGVNQVNATEMYLGELDNRIGIEKMLFSSFPVASFASTYSVTNSITDSAAGGTALATGSKTYNGAIGVDANKARLESVAEKAKKAGKRVGITTSVSVDHATPAAFYAHQESRSWYYEIANEIPASGFDFFGGSGFLKPEKDKSGKAAPNVINTIENAGYTVARGLDEYNAKKATADKMVLIQRESADQASLPYALDRKSSDLTLAQITTSAVEFLTKDNNKGFFLMVEGGKIDWACHSNDAATVLNEVIDMNEAVKVAYEFYQKHPKETLIVISADHETGGLALGNSDYTLHFKNLSYQNMSLDAVSRRITDLRKGNATWDDAKALLSECMGLFSKVKLTWEQERALHDAFNESFTKHNVKFEESLYARTEPLAVAARDVMNQIAHMGWTTGAHSGGYVPVFAIGAGSELFAKGKMENIDIPKNIAKAGGYTK